ncbi:MAG: M48 family metallopeptidase [Endomicrobiaceae bacterium]
MKTTYDFIDENRRKTILLVLLFPVTLSIITYLSLFLFVFLTQGHTSSENALTVSSALTEINGIYLQVFAVVIILSSLWTLLSFYSGHNFLLSAAHSSEADPVKHKEIIRLAENIAITAGLPVPKIYIINDESLNAFATGRNPEHSYIALTTGIINKLDRSELETVIAHETAHIRNRDTKLMMIIILVIGFFTFIGGLLLRMRFRGRNNKGAIVLILIGIILYLYGTLVAPLIRLAVSRRREYQADATAALITRNPQGLISALKKISSNPRVASLEENKIMAPMCIENPLKIQNSLFNSLSGLMSTHPPVEKRIEALQTMDGTPESFN